MRCTGRSRQSGERCKRHATEGHKFCAVHGSKARRGVRHPNFKHGKYSKSLPPRLLERYGASLGDARLVELREEIALVDARIEDVLRRVDTGESGRLWRELKKAFKAAEEARGTGFELIMFRSLGELIAGGLADWAAWDQVIGLVMQRARLAESDRKRLVEEQQMVPIAQVLTFVAAVMSSVRRHVSDPDQVAAISADLARLANVPGGGQHLIAASGGE